MITYPKSINANIQNTVSSLLFIEDNRGEGLFLTELRYLKGLRLFNAVTLDLGLMYENELAIMDMIVDEGKRSQGYGAKVMKFILNEADKHHVALRLYPRPHGRCPLNTKELVLWYENMGFKEVPGGHIRPAE